MPSSTWDDAGAGFGFAAENISKHDNGHAAYDYDSNGGDHVAGGEGCHTCSSTEHFARDCPDKPGRSGACFNCGEDGHNKADCPNPSTAECKACHEQGHTAEECEANRMHLMFADIGIEDMPAEAAWENLEKVDKSRDVDDFKVALFVYAKALPVVTLEELEKAFRGAEFNFHLVAKQQEVSDTMTIVNLQGVPGQEFVVSFQFSVKPRRAKLAEGWPSSQEENVERLASAGFVMDGFVLKCRNCDQIGHLSNACEEEKDESRGKVVLTCSNCEEPGHLARDCKAPRKINRNGCDNCGSFEHYNKDCPEERSAEGVECKGCGEMGHFSKDCPSRVEQVCFNCQQPGHRKPDCPNERVIKCKNCDELGHMSKECKKPTDWSRVECSNCKEKGHSYKRCKNPAKVEAEDSGGFGDAGGGSGFGEPDSAAGGGGGGWEDSASAAPAAGGGWGEEAPAASGW